MGVTSSGIRWPEPTDPINQGALAMRNLAEDVTTKYQSRVAAAASAVQPPAVSVPAATPLRFIAGFATVTLANGSASFTIPNGGKPWTQILYFAVSGPENATTPRNSNWTSAAAGTVGIFWVALYVANVLAGSGATNMQYFAIGA